MAHIILVTGGCRSGKSAYALRLAESLPGKRSYVATCPILDEETVARIRRHREARRDSEWTTIEEETDLCRVLDDGACDVMLVDCLTLWINNLMYHTEPDGGAINEDEIAEQCTRILAAARQRSGTVIFVTNEVGSGIVPENVAARQYRDQVGRCNQVIAADADEVTLVYCGIPLHLKKGSNHDSA
jgi:adenosylcobinamide kinase/adenosylcobinamide-phosphate guanylyltransferase